jgi:hypothetical protein
MSSEKLVKTWFDSWKEGNFMNIPVSGDFKHTSPLEGKEAYLSLVEANKDKFLGYKFEVHDEIYGEDKACVRYSALQGDFSLDVSEWYYIKDDLINEIVAYYHIGEIREDRKLSAPE